MNKRAKGKIGEDLAIDYYQFKGFELVKRNFHAHWGEIDLIFIKEDLLKFVEVKSFWYAMEDYTEISMKVGSKKLQKLKFAIEKFFQVYPPYKGKEITFEVLFINISSDKISFNPYPSPFL